MKYYLAIDIGASSGRHILGHVENGKLELEEVYRFYNGNDEKNGHLVWDTERLFSSIKEGMKKCREMGKIPCTMAIDTWGVDYALLDKEGKLIGDVYAYRDGRNAPRMKDVHAIIPENELYARTGIQPITFNTVYQLYDDKMTGKLEKAEHFLMVPDYFNYLLTGVMHNEYTDASTTGMLNVDTHSWDKEIISRLGYPEKLFGKLHQPSSVVGTLLAEVKEEVGYDLTVVSCAAHDTASAVIAVPCKVQPLYISSGTWSLMGVEQKEPFTDEESKACGFSNEGSVEFKFRYLKNIMGLWMIQSVKKEFDDKYDFGQFVDLSRAAEIDSTVAANDACFLAPKSMIEEVQNYCRRTGQKVPETPGELAKVIYVSLALCYRETADQIEKLTGRQYDTIHIVGGGSKNEYLNELTAEISGRKVVAGVPEATAVGNLVAQMIAGGDLKGIDEAKDLVINSFALKEFH